MLVLNLRAFENKKYAAHDRFHGNGPYGEIPTKKEPIRTLGYAVPYNNVTYEPSFFFYIHYISILCGLMASGTISFHT